jgi:hypothetical protein
MRHRILMTTVLFAMAATLSAQMPSYTFKGNSLRMSLAEFKATNSKGTVYINTGKPNWRGKPDSRLTQAVPTPLCSDTYGGLPWPSAPVPGEVLCNISPGAINPDGKVVAGFVVESVTYHFFENKLAAITMDFAPAVYEKIRSAFAEKYGKPSKVVHEDFQNGFGANWQGEVALWEQGTENVLLREGSGNGPAQNHWSPTSSATFFDSTLYRVGGEKPKVDF